jgi:hypothetical protein
MPLTNFDRARHLTVDIEAIGMVELRGIAV